jgi:pyruvate,orthophosphate dikinase
VSRVAERVVVLDAAAGADRHAIGNKGASIVRMLGLGLPVPPAFALPIDECRRFHAAGGHLDDDAWQEVLRGVAGLEARTGRRLGDPAAPLLVSVRSAAAVSMPGMMDTVLDLGMTDAVEEGLARESGDERFARATHARFLAEYARTVLRCPIEPPDPDTPPAAVRAAICEQAGEDVPQDPRQQLRAAISAVFDSWSSRRARAYRRHWQIPDDGGTAAIVQAMVFGNLDERSGTGVLFTRDPLTGAAQAYGEWLPLGQGEDVVSGTHDPLPLDALRASHPEVCDELLEAGRMLEVEHGDVQDVEFTVERGRLWLLQTRAAKRSPQAAVRTAVEQAEEGLITRAQALARVSPEQVVAVLAPRLAPDAAASAAVLARGTPACPGVASGVAGPDAQDAAVETVLVRPTTSPEDVADMVAATAVVTERGGSTSHAAVVTRALGRPSVVGTGEGTGAQLAGREVTVDGSAGVVLAGRLPTRAVEPAEVAGLSELLAWAAERCPVRVLADAPEVLDVDETTPPEALRGARAVRGAPLATPGGARAVLQAGVPAVVPLPGQPAAALLLRLVQQIPDPKEHP